MEAAGSMEAVLRHAHFPVVEDEAILPRLVRAAVTTADAAIPVVGAITMVAAVTPEATIGEAASGPVRITASESVSRSAGVTLRATDAATMTAGAIGNLPHAIRAGLMATGT